MRFSTVRESKPVHNLIFYSDNLFQVYSMTQPDVSKLSSPKFKSAMYVLLFICIVINYYKYMYNVKYKYTIFILLYKSELYNTLTNFINGSVNHNQHSSFIHVQHNHMRITWIIHCFGRFLEIHICEILQGILHKYKNKKICFYV